MTQKGPARPPRAGGGRRLRPNWTAVSALAAAAAAVVALVAYLMPPKPDAGVARDPTPSPVTPRPTPPDPTPSDPTPSDPTPPDPTPSDPSPSPEPATPRRPATTPAPAPTPTAPDLSPLPKVRPRGCDETTTALAAYRRNAGTTSGSQATAARQTYLDLMGVVLHADGAVGGTISRLAAEFQELSFRLSGMTGGDPNQVIADINADAAELTRLCEAG
ncbi:hypothetical protein [Nonomuraea pusilla]|uniref:Uncharacterized protein n=1 Tax=Nonomuraea pusilla TaxID=46177 RepID=A0A1H7ZL70_9ACTN|nr:hypothetical protein [Nonomuraea pusilla]SEM59332.1 hypothetical protein SAMN05660976_05525 [Nonomuraea pusilla]